jgi:hypothetical protein
MNAYAIGIGAGLAAVLMIAAITKWRSRNKPMSVAEKADFLSKRRAGTLPALAVIYFSQQASFFSSLGDGAHRGVDHFKIGAWVMLSLALLFALATKGFWFQPKEVRDLIDDENTQANRADAMRLGFLFACSAALAAYFIAEFQPLTVGEAAHLVLTFGLGAALLRFAYLERRAYKEA